MKIKVVLNKEKYIKSYVEYGDIEDSTVEVDVPSSNFYKEETYKFEWNGKKFEPTQLIESREILNDNFIENYKYYKYENNTLIFDKEKKKTEEKKKIEEKKVEIQNQIIDLEMRKQMFISKNWDISSVEKQIKELEDKLRDIVGENNV